MNLHLLNIALHVAAGALALLIGAAILFLPKGTATHRRLGRWFGVATLAVCFFAATGLVLFRFMPMFAVLTVLISYQLVSGWHSVTTQAQGPSRFDAMCTALAALSTLALVGVMRQQGVALSTVLLATLGGTATLLAYDTLRWTFPRHWYRWLWRYEHVYKMLASLFGMLSALVGNVVRVGQPWSQLLPTALGLVVIAYFFWQLRRGRRIGPAG